MGTQLENRIMRRVYFIFYCRKAIGKFALKIYLILLLLWGLFHNISFVSVFRNTKSIAVDVGSVSSFYKYAFIHTEFVVQTISVAIIAILAFTLGNNLKGLLYKEQQDR